ncbi:MAG: SDR family oxidoreductase [Jatrophihabitans sp.]|uniref:SDR family oxidoreductase n=1 Tax=Jatrophihabitans sp. TaxID=1932789 RepID=UPI003F7FB379
MAELTGKVVLITGAARGIGAGLAQALAKRGCRLVLLDVDGAPLQELAASLGECAVGIVADVTDLGSVQAAVDQGVERFGGIDIVVANAGIASYGSVLQVDPATFRRVIDINVNGVFHTVRAALPSVIERRGYVLVVSSLAAFAAAPGLAAYNASKAGVEHFGNALRLEVAHHGVDVGTAHMSWIDTPLVQDAKDDLGAFNDMLAALPGPLGRTTSLAKCIDAFVAGIAGRKRRIYVPRWVAVMHGLRVLLASKAGDQATLQKAPAMLEKMDAEVAALGRSTSARNTAVDNARS